MRVRRRWMRTNSTITNRTPATTRIMVVLSISISFPFDTGVSFAQSQPLGVKRSLKRHCSHSRQGVEPTLKLAEVFESPEKLHATQLYLTEVRRRWMRTPSTIANRTPATIRMSVTLSMFSPFLSRILFHRAEH